MTAACTRNKFNQVDLLRLRETWKISTCREESSLSDSVRAWCATRTVAPMAPVDRSAAARAPLQVRIVRCRPACTGTVINGERRMALAAAVLAAGKSQRADQARTTEEVRFKRG